MTFASDMLWDWAYDHLQAIGILPAQEFDAGPTQLHGVLYRFANGRLAEREERDDEMLARMRVCQDCGRARELLLLPGNLWSDWALCANGCEEDEL